MQKHLYVTHMGALISTCTHPILQSVFIDWSLTRHQMSLLLLIPKRMANETILHTVAFEGLCVRVSMFA